MSNYLKCLSSQHFSHWNFFKISNIGMLKFLVHTVEQNDEWNPKHTHTEYPNLRTFVKYSLMRTIDENLQQLNQRHGNRTWQKMREREFVETFPCLRELQVATTFPPPTILSPLPEKFPSIVWKHNFVGSIREKMDQLKGTYNPAKRSMVFLAIFVVGAIPPYASVILSTVFDVPDFKIRFAAQFTMAMSSSRLCACLYVMKYWFWN